MPDDLGPFRYLNELSVCVLSGLDNRPERRLEVERFRGRSSRESLDSQDRINSETREEQVTINPDQILPSSLDLPSEDSESLEPKLRLDVSEVVRSSALAAETCDSVSDGAPLVLGAHVDD